MPLDFDDEQYLDVFQNIEMAVVAIYRDRPALTDFDVDQAYNTLLRAYNAELRGRTFRQPRLNDLSSLVYEQVKIICDWRLGRPLPADVSPPVPGDLTPRTLDEMIGCLKRLRKSISLWTKEGGRQGYLRYVQEFLPR